MTAPSQMEFRLAYEGPLHGQGAKSSHKWEIRRALHPQLQRLWQERPLRDAATTLLAHPARPEKVSVIVEKRGLLFAPLVTERLRMWRGIISRFDPRSRDAL